MSGNSTGCQPLRLVVPFRSQGGVPLDAFGQRANHDRFAVDRIRDLRPGRR
jgi:hypothetical protein